jgi:hypothetical protein
MTRVEGARHIEGDQRPRPAGADRQEQRHHQAERRLPGPEEHHRPDGEDRDDHGQQQVAAPQRVSRDEQPDDGPGHHVADHQHREHCGRRGHVVAQARREEGVAPHDAHQRRNGAADQVRPESQLRARASQRAAQPRQSSGGGDRTGRQRGFALPHDDGGDGRGEHRGRARDEQRGLPARRVQQEGEGHRGDDLPQLPDGSDPLAELREHPTPEPVGQQADDRDEGRGIPHPHQDPSHDREPEVRRERQDGLPRRHDQRAEDDEVPRTDPIDQNADRDLERGVDHDLQHGDHGDGCCVDVEPLRRIDRGNAEGGPLCDADQIGEHGPGEDQPRARGVHSPRLRPAGLAGRRLSHRGAQSSS